MLLRFSKTAVLAAALAALVSPNGFAQNPMPAQTPSPAQSPASGPSNLPALTLQQAEALAIQNHPQIQAGQNEINYANQQIVESRSAYYPEITGDLTGSQGNNLSRVGAGDLSASRLFN